MAAVRHFPIVVYELELFLQDQYRHPAPSVRRSRRPWMANSLEAAERFVISRAAAVVVRSGSMRQELMRRGVVAEHIFVIPRPLPVTEGDGAHVQFPPSESHEDHFGIFSTVDIGANWRAWLGDLLAAAQIAKQKIPKLMLYLQIDESVRREASPLLAQFAPTISIQRVDKLSAASVLSSCSLVVAGDARRSGATPGENPLAAAALREGKPLLAADLSCNRDVSANGSGCIWFVSGDVADMARRIVFLASDGAFRSALAASGNRYWCDRHDPVRIAEQYDAVYQHAFARRHSGKWHTPAISWQPSHACI